MSCLSIHVRNLENNETIYQVTALQNDATNIATGIFASLATYPVIEFITNKVCDLMTHFKFDLSGTQDAIQIIQWIQEIGSTLARTVLQVTFLFYVVILGPILEEVIFRGGFNVWVKNKMDVLGYDVINNSLHQAIYWTICGTAFGAMHLSPFQGWMNVPIFVATSLMGIAFSALKDELTNDLTAPTIAHMAHNGISVFRLLKA